MYEATDIVLERAVAVKVMREDLVASQGAGERFRREARAVAALSHPHVVTIYDFGVAALGRGFVVMELLAGVTLREELLQQVRLSPVRTVEILRGVCAAVEAAHRRHLIHRDLKPENIFLARGESIEVPKVLDFGLAKLLPAVNASSAETRSGQIVGTLRYMAPERLQGGDVEPA